MLSFVVLTRIVITWIFTAAASRALTKYTYGIRARLVVDSSHNKGKEERRGGKLKVIGLRRR
jgi:hypothetical protein